MNRRYSRSRPARTGIFFYYQTGERLRDFPEALAEVMARENVFFYDAFYPSKPPSSFEFEPITEEMLYRVHSRRMVETVKETGDFAGALFSASGTVRAAEKIWTGEIDNAFVFTGYGDHHAGTDFFGGGCYLNGAALAIDRLRRSFGANKFSIVDTDAHHGDGTWQIFESDPDVLYVCFCPHPDSEKNGNVNIQVPLETTDEEYKKLVAYSLIHRLEAFRPQVLFWNWGYDATRGEYGDLGLTPGLHVSLAREIKAAADEFCNGRLVTVLCGGRQRPLAAHLCPRIIAVLAE